MYAPLIPAHRSIIPALDVYDLSAASAIAAAASKAPGVGAFKFGALLALAGNPGMETIIDTVRKSSRPGMVFIYDHQKGGTDIPEMGERFAHQLQELGMHAVIIFPLTGPATQTAWTKALASAGLRVIVGGMMTHEGFLESEGGYITDDAPERIFSRACDEGVTDFVVPGTKLVWVERLRSLLDRRLGSGNFALYAPGFITQGGDISECGKAAGPNFHAIVGRDIYGRSTTAEQREAVARLTSAVAA